MYTVLKTRPVLLSRDRVKQVAGQPCVVDAIKKLDFRQKQSQRSRCHFFILRLHGLSLYLCEKRNSIFAHYTLTLHIVHLFLYAARESSRQR